ncbi:protein kinase [Spirosoma sp.]|uniref:serine/threonine-protein kinase n=1 Tax=Spirosoma sp. TaxID=1899569 RepID=UPI0026323D68|nr:protein kinase [Spirosoma sp.]MCX6216967.1 protein kinase [Spirosoma sp.]
MSIRKLLTYNLLHELGQGGMASVWYAENSVGRPFAIKLLKPELIAYESSVSDRFRNEAQIMVKLDHPYIRRVEDYYEEGDTLAIVMEYLDGQDMHRYIRKQGRVPEKQAVDLFLKVLDAFGYVHKKGYFHRDVKPANLFLTAAGQVKVMDFGIAKIVGTDMGLTQIDALMGSPLYMSPEQILAPKDVDYRTDIYSLGVTLYTLLAGTKPYDDQQQSAFGIQSAIVQQPLPNLPHVSAVVNEAIQKATEKKPTDRFQTCEAFAEALTASSSIPEDATELNQPVRYSETQAAALTEEATQLRQPVQYVSPKPAIPVTRVAPSKPEPVVEPAQSAGQVPVTAMPATTASPSRLGWVIGVVLGVAVLAGGAYALLGRQAKEPSANPTAKVRETTDETPIKKPASDPEQVNGIRQGIADYQQEKYSSALAQFSRYQDTPAFLSNPEAMTDLGVIYYFGGSNTDAIQPDLVKAKEWFQKGANGNSAKAYYYLGLLADGVDFKNVNRARGLTNEAVALYQKGADGGDSFAQVTLGELYLAGNRLVTKQDACAVLNYLKQAATDSANKEAQSVLDDFKRKGFCH